MRVKIGGSHLLEHPDRLEQWLAGDVPGPLCIEIAPTHGCNHNCVHCDFQQFSRYGPPHLLNPDTLINFLYDFRRLGGVEVFFAGNGEPLLHPQLAEFVEYGYDQGIVFCMSTNGILLSEDLLHRLLPRMAWIRFSVNGGTASSYAKIHRCPESDFHILSENIKRALDYRDRLKLPVRLRLQYVPVDMRLKAFEDIVDLHLSLGTDQLLIRNLVYDKRVPPVPSHDVVNYLHLLEIEGKVEVRWEWILSPSREAKWKSCYGIYFRTNMDADGNLWTCCRHFMTDSTYGNIYKKSFGDIWHSDLRRKIFTEVSQGNAKSNCAKWCQASSDNLLIDRYLEGGSLNGNSSELVEY